MGIAYQTSAILEVFFLTDQDRIQKALEALHSLLILVLIEQDLAGTSFRIGGNIKLFMFLINIMYFAFTLIDFPSKVGE